MTHFSELSNNTNARAWKDPGLRKTLMHVCVLYMAVYAVGYDGSLLNGFQALPQWGEHFNHPQGYTLGLISASYYLPKIPCPLIVAPIADRFGRKACLIPGSIVLIAGSVLSAFSTNQSMLIGSRVLLGLGTTTCQATAALLIQELVHPRLRHLCGSFFNCTFYAGAIIASWLTFGMTYVGNTSWAWRAPSLLQALGPVILLLSVFTPESPRFLVKGGRVDEAHKILAKYHANGNMDDELVQFELREIITGIEFENASKNTSWADFLRTPANRRRLAIIVMIASAAQFSGNGIVQYYLVPVLRQVGITSAVQQAGINGGLSVSNFLAALLGASLVERAGRRTLFLTSIAGMFGCYAIIAGLAGGFAQTHQTTVGTALVPFIFIFMGFYSIAITPVPMLYIPEILPMALRAKGMCLYMTVTGACLAFNNFVNPIALAAISWRYYFVYLGMLGIYFGLFFVLIRETRGLTTEEAAMVFESDDVKAAHAADVARAKVSDDKTSQDEEKDDINHLEKA